MEKSTRFNLRLSGNKGGLRQALHAFSGTNFKEFSRTFPRLRFNFPGFQIFTLNSFILKNLKINYFYVYIHL